MKTPYQNKNIILGVTGSIAAYKAADLASKLAQEGASVRTILTHSAQRFVTSLTFQSVTGSNVFTDDDLWGREGHIQHIGLAKDADFMVIAPLSANTMAKLANGIADNLLTVTALAAQCPMLIAPAMDGGMFSHPATQSNLETLRERGVTVVGPVEGHLASGMVGLGRMAEPEEVLGHIRLLLSREGPLSGKRILVTAGGTQEAIDPVRSIINRSSGKQGFALAQAALDLGCEVTLVTGPVHLQAPTGARRVDVVSAEEMLEAILQEAPHADALIMAAAVADFQPVRASRTKLKRKTGIPEIKLKTTPDILEKVAEMRSTTHNPKVVVGFAAESQDLIENARAKLQSKKLELIIANDITAGDAGFEVDTNRVTILDKSEELTPLPLMSKAEVAEVVLERVAAMLTKNSPV